MKPFGHSNQFWERTVCSQIYWIKMVLFACFATLAEPEGTLKQIHLSGYCSKHIQFLWTSKLRENYWINLLIFFTLWSRQGLWVERNGFRWRPCYYDCSSSHHTYNKLYNSLFGGNLCVLAHHLTTCFAVLSKPILCRYSHWPHDNVGFLRQEAVWALHLQQKQSYPVTLILFTISTLHSFVRFMMLLLL